MRSCKGCSIYLEQPFVAYAHYFTSCKAAKGAMGEVSLIRIAAFPSYEKYVRCG